MMVRYHSDVQRDIRSAMKFYFLESGPKLADDFYDEFDRNVEHAAHNARSAHFDTNGLRRVNLPRFPYHFLYEEKPGCIFVWVLRHDKRHPKWGLWRRKRR